MVIYVKKESFMENIDFNNQTDLKELWNRILDEFKDINQNYQTNMSKKNKNNRVRYIISQLKRENKKENEGSLTKSSWIIKNRCVFCKEFAKKIFVKNFENQQLRNEQTLILTGIAHFYCKTQYNKL